MATIPLETELVEAKHGGKEVIDIDDEDDELSPIEEVRLTVSNEDDPTLPVWTFRMWSIGLFSCALLSFLNTFFSYRTEPLVISVISVQVASLPLGKFMARTLPTRKFRIGSKEFSLNPGEFNIKEHVLISIFANAGAGFGSGPAYAVGIVTIVKAFYVRNISFLASWILVITTQVLGYGWAGILRKYVVDPATMWWPSSLVQVSLFRALHEKDNNRMSRGKFFLIALVCSFSWYVVPDYLFTTISTISWVCWLFPKSITAHQIGSGMRGLGIGSLTLDWSVIASYLGSPLISPFFAIVNITVGYILTMYVVLPTAYWGFNLYNAKNFAIFSKNLFDDHGEIYNVTAIVNDKFEIDMPAYKKQGHINLSVFFSLTYGIGFAGVISTITHVALFNGREMYEKYKAAHTGKVDIHTRLMRNYRDIPTWWFHILLLLSLALSLALCIFMKDEVQLPWWGLLFAAAIASVFTLPISSPGLNVITEYIMGLILPGEPIANVCFKTYGYISMAQAISFLSDFKLGHYMKIPPISMFIVQCIGTVIAGTVNIGVAWWLLTTVENICQESLLPPDSPWTCRIFGSLGYYSALNWFFLFGAIGPLIVWLLHKAFPSQKWIALINLPVLLGATAVMPPASTVNFNCWIIVGLVFSYYVFRYRKTWWQRYNYVLSAALDAGVAFMAVLVYLSMNGKGISWWGTDGEHCELATCPTAEGLDLGHACVSSKRKAL
ncbi:putative oligopeptide transporter, OPT superfamily [Rosa chinensis]|uniref:Putative oligopeptide transporter, OPT superfamily n=1 Tax=Rosa chinensis TaxID=74649 RepID=A0A2P6PG65_ROSCH|nr:putative oligopeptide transporter, OPT superfamily [Rosa chinensis]